MDINTSVILWNTGEPRQEGVHLITIDEDYVTLDTYNFDTKWNHHKDERVSAWCHINEIKPYRENKSTVVEQEDKPSTVEQDAKKEEILSKMKENIDYAFSARSEHELLKITACELIKIGAKLDIYLNDIHP